MIHHLIAVIRFPQLGNSLCRTKVKEKGDGAGLANIVHTTSQYTNRTWVARSASDSSMLLGPDPLPLEDDDPRR